MSYIGDFRLGDTFDTKFTTVQSTGAPTTLAGSPVISAYPGNSTTELTAGITLTVDFDARTGMHNVRVVATSGNGYATATNYQLVITVGTVNGVSAVGYVVAEFSIENRSALMPAIVARTLVVDAAGLADANTVKVGPTGAGTAQTARDVGASVLLSAGSGTGQLDFTAGVVKANLAQILGTALTETAGLLAGGFKKFFNIATPAATMDHGVLVDTVTTYTGNTVQTGDNFARLGAPVGASLSADLAAVKADTVAVHSGTAQAGAGSTITLAAGASATDSLYVGETVKITGATGVGQARIITGYVGATKVATVDRAWQTNPDNTSTYAVLATDAAKLDSSLRSTDVNSANLDATVSSRTKPADTQARVTLVDTVTLTTTTTTLTNAPSDSSGVTTLLARLSALRAGYLDNLSAGAAALEASLQGLITTVGAAGAGLTATATAVWAVATRVLTASTNISPIAVTSNIKKNQALLKFQFLMTDSTTHAPSTGLTVTCTRSIDGGAFAAGTLANVTEVAAGTYTVDFGAGDLNGNVVVLKATAAASDTTFERIVTQP